MFFSIIHPKYGLSEPMNMIVEMIFYEFILFPFRVMQRSRVVEADKLLSQVGHLAI